MAVDDPDLEMVDKATTCLEDAARLKSARSDQIPNKTPSWLDGQGIVLRFKI